MNPLDVLAAIINGLWLMLPAYLPNSFAAVWGSRKMDRYFGPSKPVDFGKSWKGKRILGDGKTFRGTIGGILSGIVIGLIQTGIAEVTPLEGFGGSRPGWFVIIVLLSTGALLGDAMGSFVKRRIGRERGADVPGLDQYDFVLGSWLLLLVFAPGWLWDHYFEGEHIFAAAAFLLITPFLHRAVNKAGFRMGVKDVPW
jgi:CDP-2,3-bis-(O-geranylgeranyl)-sn-glycerol synthase